MAPTGCKNCTENFMLGRDQFPVPHLKVNLFLANYSLMFLSFPEILQVVQEIVRTADERALLVIEMYPAKDSETRTDGDILIRLKAILNRMQVDGWDLVYTAKNRMILQAGLAVSNKVHQDRFRRTMRLLKKGNQ